MADKATLMRMMEAGQEEILGFADRLSPEERNTSGTAENWAYRDILAHIGTWRLRNSQSISNRMSGQEPEPEIEEDDQNLKIFERHKNSSWEEIRQLLDDSYQAFLSALELLDDESINSLEPEGRPLWRRLASDSLLHPNAHLRPELIKLGDVEAATRMSEREAELAGQLDDSPEWKGTIQYNLACYYALMGDRETALKMLETALQLNPQLIDWSQQDSDLASLHGTPEFEALLGSVGPKGV